MAIRKLPLIVLGLLSWSGVADASEDSRLCVRAAVRAAERHEIPPDLLQAIATVETRGYRDAPGMPWPWTLNIAGRGLWFDSRAEALAFAKTELAGGQSLIDLGCFQVNFHWHGKAFRRIDEVLDPQTSADYAASFLKSLYQETGDWIAAVGFYHSRRDEAAKRYRGLVTAAMSTLNRSDDLSVDGPRKTSRRNISNLASLWPLTKQTNPQMKRRAGSIGLLSLRRAAEPLIAASKEDADG